MPLSKASNAVMAIARTKFGNRITAAQYREMAALQNVQAVADYLKNTKYAGALNRSGVLSFRRGSLEQALHDHIIHEIYGLCSFEKSLGSPIFYAFMLELETNEILHFLRCFAAGCPERYVLDLLGLLNEMVELDLIGMSQLKSREELVSFFKRYPAYQAVAQAIAYQPGENLNITPIEVLLDKLTCQRVCQIISQHFSGNELAQLLEIYKLPFEIDDLQTIYRSKKIFSESGDLLRSLLVGESVVLSEKKVSELLASRDAQSFMALLFKTPYGAVVKSEEAFLSRGLEPFLLRRLLKTIHFSASPAAVAMAYTRYLTLEGQNIIHIVEGIRYKISIEQIMQTLLLCDQEAEYGS